jgi:hypothetical protein
MKGVIAIISLSLLLCASAAFAQNAASNKAFFASERDGLKLRAVNGEGWSDAVTLFEIPAALKTSNGGAVSAILSMESALWTYNITEAINLGGRYTSSSRAAIKAWVELDDKKMEPGKVVFADRLQATGLTLNLDCSTKLGDVELPCDVTGSVAMELFERTKNANSFTFFLGPLDPTIHKIVVKAQALIECRSTAPGEDTQVIPCPKAILDGYNAKTAAAIGKATLLVEEQQNWGSIKN